MTAPGPLTRREWRWTWLALAIRWPVTILVLLPLLPLWALAKGFLWAYDALVDLAWHVQTWAYNLDLARRGPPVRLPAPELGEEWQARASGRQ